jgi:hypothetical protein
LHEQDKYLIAIDLEALGIDKSIINELYNKIGIRKIVNAYLRDKEQLFFILLDIEGMTSDIVEKLVFSIGIILEEFGYTEGEGESENGTIRIPCHV